MTLPNYITIFRLLLIPVFVYFAGSYGRSVSDGAPQDWLRITAVWLFLVAAISDFADGWIARHWNQKSRLGSVLDPLADKGLMLSAIVTLTVTGWSEQHRFPTWFPVLVILRDVLSALGAWAIQLRHGRVRVRPHWTGKVCNAAQIVAIAWVMLRLEFIPPMVATVVAAVFTVVSGAFHLWDGAVQFVKGPHPETSVVTN
jgi:cardiolipin synthase (CMP-forming)